MLYRGVSPFKNAVIPNKNVLSELDDVRCVFKANIPSSVNITYAQCNEFLYLVTGPRFCACIRVLITSIGVFNTAPIEFAIPPESLCVVKRSKKKKKKESNPARKERRKERTIDSRQ